MYIRGPGTLQINATKILLIQDMFLSHIVLPYVFRCGKNLLWPVSIGFVHLLICFTFPGVKIRGHIRGCLDDILHNGFNQSIVAWYRWLHRDSCHQYRKRDLFKLPHDQSDDSLIHVCTCYADHCNPAPSWGSPLFFALSFTLIFRILLRLSLNN